MGFVEIWKKYGEPITGISIIIFIIFSVVMINQDHKLKEQINENCGWGEEDYKCFCEKSEALRIQNILNSDGSFIINLSSENVTLD